MKFLHHEGGKRPVSCEVGTEQDAAGLDIPHPQYALEEPRRHVQDGNCLTDQRQRRGQMLERLSIARHRQMAGPSPRGHPKLG